MAKKTQNKYEDKIERLEEIIDELQKDSLDLNKALEIYEEGIKLYRECKEHLDITKEKIKILEENI